MNYYDISKLLETQSQYYILLGQRANGKSYQVKKTAIEKAMNGEKFVYLRRWVKDCKQRAVTSYFEDMPISKLTSRKYNEVKAINGYIYLMKKDRNGEELDRKEIGRYCGLNDAEHYKSQVFKDYTSIIYEEFITDGIYLDDEPRKLQQFVSTVARLSKIEVFLIGNTLTRVCPYFSEWCLEGVLKQKQGTIEIYHFHTDNEETVNIAVEYCTNTNNENYMFFGSSASQIIKGEWDVKEVPKLPRKQYEYEKVYEVLVKYQSFKFVIELLIENKNGGKICYVYPSTTDRKIYRIITDEFSDLPNISNRLDRTKKAEQYIADCILLDKICYSDNLTGSDFSKVLEQFRIW
jgi:hypothetical protein